MSLFRSTPLKQQNSTGDKILRWKVLRGALEIQVKAITDSFHETIRTELNLIVEIFHKELLLRLSKQRHWAVLVPSKQVIFEH